MGLESSKEYYNLRDCLRPPIPHLLEVAEQLSEAVEQHLIGNHAVVEKMIAETNTTEARDYIESLWGAASKYPEQKHYLRKREVKTLPERLPKAKDRMPTRKVKLELIDRDGFFCRYCRLPVIPAEVRKLIHLEYPEALPWGTTNATQHAAFQALWLQFDHVIPAAYGGDNSLRNMVISCAGCNFAKWRYHLAELGLNDPRERAPKVSNWVGLTNFKEGTFV